MPPGETDYLVKSLKRIYDECEKLQERDGASAAGGVANKFNEILPRFKEAYPEDKVIQEMEKVNVSLRGRAAMRLPENLQEIKMNTLTLADRLDINTEQFEDASSSGPMNVIRLEQNQAVSQQVSVNQIIDQVNQMMLKESDKAELEEIVREFEQETAQEDPDPSRLRDLINSAQDYSVDVAAKMAMLALSHGIVGILGL